MKGRGGEDEEEARGSEGEGFLRLLFVFVVSLGHVGPTNAQLSSRIWFIVFGISHIGQVLQFEF